MRYERIGVVVEINERSSSAMIEEFVVFGSVGIIFAIKKEMGYENVFVIGAAKMEVGEKVDVPDVCWNSVSL